MANGRWIPENRATRIPRAHICLDTESFITETASGESHTFRCAVTSLDRMSRKNDDWLPTSVAIHDDVTSLWDWVTSVAKPKERTVLVAHNLGYDLRVADAFNELVRREWTLEHLSLAPGSTWATWRRNGATLSMVDSMSWVPTTLANIGNSIGQVKVSLPDRSDTDATWVDRCRQDAEILRDAWLRIIRFLREEDCGNWRPTGAGQSWSAWRHKFITHPIFSHDDAEVRAVERKAAWTGRAEAWRFGRQSDGPFTEWDFSTCYAQIAQRHDVPTMLVGELPNVSLGSVTKAMQRYAVLAECAVTTASPTVPTSDNGRVVWPVGSFTTALWDCEIDLAMRHGARVEITRAWAYRRAPALRAWADWVLERVYARPGDVDPVVRAVCKHWSRALVGRFGTRYSVWEPFGESVGGAVGLLGFSDTASGVSGELLSVGGKSWLASAVTDHPLSAPQVMSWINAKARVDLWEAMQHAGFGHVVYVDTDSLIVTKAGDARLAVETPTGLRRKARYQSLDILGTRRLLEDRKLKAAGVPKGALRTGRATWSTASWESLHGSLKGGDAGSVNVVTRKVTFRERDSRRRRLADGSSAPYEIGKS